MAAVHKLDPDRPELRRDSNVASFRGLLPAATDATATTRRTCAAGPDSDSHANESGSTLTMLAGVEDFTREP